jgi:hypothetical protein
VLRGVRVWFISLTFVIFFLFEHFCEVTFENNHKKIADDETKAAPTCYNKGWKLCDKVV